MGNRIGWNGFDGFALKMIAIVSMTVDHSAASVLLLCIKTGKLSKEWITVYRAMRGMGRIAFPIFCFLLVEGYFHTRSKMKYLGRLFLFSLISELPFDLALKGQLFYREHQNVFFTLCIGMGVICILDELKKKVGEGIGYYMAAVAVIFAGMELSAFLRTDYKRFGVLMIVLLFYAYRQRMAAVVLELYVLILFFENELPALFALPLLMLYNGKRGHPVKYFFYLFYPVHLAILYVICCRMGLYASFL